MKPNAKCFLLNYPNTDVWVTSRLILASYLNGWVLALLPCMPCSACTWEGYTPNNCVFKHIFLSLVLFNLIIIFSFPLVGLTFLVIIMIYAVLFPCLRKHLGVQLCQQDPVTIVGDIPVTTDGRELCLLVRLVSTSRKMVLFVPRPWYRRCC
mgnify:CR=1 FL=1